MRSLVIAHGELPSAALLARLAAGADLVVGADGGGTAAIAAGLRVDAIVGDLDSLSEAARENSVGTRIISDTDPDHTDLEKAVVYCLEHGADRIDITGAGGGRADHALANLSVLRVFRGRADIRVADDLFEVRLVEGEAAIEGPAGTVVSLVAIGRCEGVTTRGLRWPLEDRTLEFSPLGVHNEIERQPASVAVRSGDLYLFVGRWTERHGEGS